MLKLSRLTLRVGPEALLEDASLQLHPGWRVGIIGNNGCGKTSLFRLLLGELQPDDGEVFLPAGTRIAHMAQETASGDISAVDHVLGGDRILSQVLADIETAEQAGDGERLAQLHARIADLDGYTARTRAEQLLAGLGFPANAMEQPVRSFSGGWRMRMDLARTLMRPSDLLLLDEPTNHLDLDAVLWLEQWLQQYSGTLLMISHDRDFIDNVVGHVVHFDNRRLVQYRGNYSGFERQRAERLAQQQAAFEKQQQRIREIESFVSRFRAKATKARQAQSRLKELERMEEIAPAHIDSPFRFRFPDADRAPNPLIALRELDAGYDGEAILKNIGLSLLPGQRLGLLGANGAGKSTLIRTIVGELPPLRGQRTPGEYLRIGYFHQHQVDALVPDKSPLQHLFMDTDGNVREQELRNFLGGFGFSGDDALAPAGRMSGGEKARLALARIAWQRPNLLLLDEPTNHLDLEMRHALDLALQSFSGAVVLVTHDRHLLRDTVDEFWLVANGRVAPFDGDLDDYAAWLRDHRASNNAPAHAANTTPARDRRAERQEAARRREALKPLQRKVQQLEKKLQARQAELAEMENRLADSALYDPEHQGDLQALLRQQAELADTVETLEAEWLEASEQLEQAQPAP